MLKPTRANIRTVVMIGTEKWELDSVNVLSNVVIIKMICIKHLYFRVKVNVCYM